MSQYSKLISSKHFFCSATNASAEILRLHTDLPLPVSEAPLMARCKPLRCKPTSPRNSGDGPVPLLLHRHAAAHAGAGHGAAGARRASIRWKLGWEMGERERAPGWRGSRTAANQTVRGRGTKTQGRFKWQRTRLKEDDHHRKLGTQTTETTAQGSSGQGGTAAVRLQTQKFKTLKWRDGGRTCSETKGSNRRVAINACYNSKCDATSELTPWPSLAPLGAQRHARSRPLPWALLGGPVPGPLAAALSQGSRQGVTLAPTSAEGRGTRRFSLPLPSSKGCPGTAPVPALRTPQRREVWRGGSKRRQPAGCPGEGDATQARGLQFVPLSGYFHSHRIRSLWAPFSISNQYYRLEIIRKIMKQNWYKIASFQILGVELPSRPAWHFATRGRKFSVFYLWGGEGEKKKEINPLILDLRRSLLTLSYV